MPYAEILSMLDAEIARLEMARELLLPFSAPVERRSTRGRKRAAERAPEPLPEAEPTPELVAVQKVPSRRNYGPRTKRPRAVPQAESALRSTVPAGPVVVPASTVKNLHSQRTAPAQPVEAAPAWRADVAQARRSDDLLQRFMEMGSSAKSDVDLAPTGTRRS